MRHRLWFLPARDQAHGALVKVHSVTKTDGLPMGNEFGGTGDDRLKECLIGINGLKTGGEVTFDGVIGQPFQGVVVMAVKEVLKVPKA